MRWLSAEAEQGIPHEGLLLLNTAEKVLDASYEPSREGHQIMKANIHAIIAMVYDNIGISKREERMRRRKSALRIPRTLFDK